MARAENLHVTSNDDGSVVIAHGQIDSHTSPELDQSLAAAPADAKLALDLAGVTFIDSSGLRVIVRAHKRQLDGGGQLAIHAPSESVVRLLEITGLSGQLTIDPDPAG